ncbi:Protein CBG04842 [Caenorhabditis briggsae]|uniref:Protein CBG04842 n=1 Tax=Caenorhabditis briggsae TaxID=6238 RepID=A8WYL6_CAEBR|nr:Protein CBG04842 [Caenorhabditis briggsae]CAP25474.2 Protein CBG04842 [Caenorhabditis briggsae]
MTSLNKMPDIVLSAIIENLDYRSLMILRKTCHDIRNFIDDSIPASSITEIQLNVNPEQVVLEFMYSESVSQEKLYSLCGQEAFDLFWKDFEIILKHQKLILKSFSVTLEYRNGLNKLEASVRERVNLRFLSQLKALLEPRRRPLQVEKLDLIMGDQEKIMCVLPYIDADKINEIMIYPGPKRETVVFPLDKVVETEQWKNAKKLATSNFVVVEPIEKFTHFDNCRIFMDTISVEMIQKLKENLLFSKTLKSFELNHRPHYQSPELTHIFRTVFDGSFQDDVYEDCWFSRIPGDNEHALVIRSCYYSWITFSRREWFMIKPNYERFN